MYLSSTLTLLAVVTVPVTSRSLPTTVISATTRRATTIATYYGEKARMLAQEQKQNRRLMDADASSGFLFGNFPTADGPPANAPSTSFDSEFGDFGASEYGDSGDSEFGDFGSAFGDFGADFGDGDATFGDFESGDSEFGDFGGSTFGDFGSEFGDFGAEFGDGDAATFGDLTFQPELCPFLSDSVYYDDDELYDDADLTLEDLMGSCDVNCDIAEENIVTTCKFSGQPVCDDQGEFCIDDLIVTATVPFDFGGISGEVCMTYTAAPADMSLQGKEGCISMDIDMDFGAAMAMAFDPDADAEDFGDAMQITECGFTLGDEVCDCDICEDGLGGDITCPDIGLISEECAAFKDGLTDLEDASEIGDIASSVVRFTRMESEGGGLRR